MRRTKDPACRFAMVLATAVAWSGVAERTTLAQQFTLTGTVSELVARGINAGFEEPVLAAADTEAFSTANIGPGWSFNLVSGVSSNHGVQNPALGFYGEVNPLPAPLFEGNQIGFINLDPFTQAEIVSEPIGLLRAGQTYTLNVAVGARNSTTFRDVAYRAGLRASDGTDLGEFATITLDPGSSDTNIAELTYTLNTSSVPSYVGDAVSIVVGGFNTGDLNGQLDPGFTQANFDNIRLSGTFDELPLPSSALLTINRQTGSVTLSNTGSTNLNVLGYSLTSEAGSFNQAAWNRIGGSLTNLTDPASATDLSEMDFQGSGTTLTTTTPHNLGNVWIRTPFEDVEGELLLGDGSILPLDIDYTGMAIQLGDLNADGAINAVDWALFKAGQGSDFTGLTQAQAYALGDLTGDLRHDLFDFLAFRNAFETANGAGSFAAMLAAVPEPTTGLMLLAGGVLTFVGRRRRSRRPAACSTSRLSRHAATLLAGVVACALAARPASAQNVVAHWSFDTPTLTIDGGNIVAVADATGNHNATPGLDGTGGGSGTAFVSAPFPAATSSVSGQFGQALQFSGDNFLLFNNLTELMEVNGAPSYSISMWVNTTSTPVGGTPFMTLSNWGNEPAASGPTRFTYAFGPAGTSSMRGQSRWANPASGGGGTTGTDIFASTVTTPGPVTDGEWHMLTWTFDTTSGVLSRYYDGAFIDSITSTAASFAMADSSSPVGGMGIKGDDGQMLPDGFRLDEVWVIEGILTDEQVESLFTTNSIVPISLTLRVDPTTGQVQLRNDTEEAIALSAYRITSAAGSLNPSGWDPIATGTPVPGFPQGTGSGDGWEVPDGESPVGDFNNDGIVNAADYTVWRDGLGTTHTAGQYDDWKANFGSIGGSGGNPNPGELVEWYLQGESTLAAGGAISLGQAFSIGQAQDLVFQFTSADAVRTGVVEFGAIGSGALTGQVAVPEPSTAILTLVAGCLLLGVGGARRRCRSLLPARRCAAGLSAFVATGLLVSAAPADVFVDRDYRFGDNTPGNNENGVSGQPVGSANTTSPGTTLDHEGPGGSFQDLVPVGGPVYADVSGRPGAGPGSIGIAFDGVDDYLFGFSLGFPPLSRGTINGGGSGTLNFNGVYQRGMQLWVFPHSGATAAQHIVSDTTQHGIRINAGGNWALVHAGTEVNSGVPVAFSEWHHVMAAMPDNSAPHKAVLYVNGVAVALHRANYSSAVATNAQSLVVGANSHADGTQIGTANFFRGVLDDLEMFIWGNAYEHTTGEFIDWGTFNFLEDNGFAAMNLSSVLGDLTNSGSITQGDVDAFVAGWGNEKRLSGMRVGDITTYQQGDLNFDGITDLRDAKIFRELLLGSGAGLNLSAFAAVTGLAVPEPASLTLGGISIGALLVAARRRRSRHL